MSRPIQPQLNVQPPRARGKARVAGVMAAALVISWGAPAANAYWQTLNSGALGATADSILAMAAPTAAASAGAATVGWAQGSTAAGRPVSGYTVARYSSESGGIKVDAGGACAGTVTTLSCSEAALPSGTWYYTVTPLLAAWAGTESARSGGVTAADTTAPDAPTITAPAIVNIANASSVQVSGTAGAGLSVTITATDAGGVQKSSQPVSADGSGQWTVSDFDLRGLADGTITYSAVATNAAGNTSDSKGATTTKDTVAPTATVTLSSPANNAAGVAEKGDTVSIKYSGDINSNSICNTWTNGAQPPEIAGNNVVTVTISSDILTVSTGGAAACVPNIGPVTLGGNYVTSGSLTFKGNSNSGPSKIAWDNATQTLTITLGARTGNPSTDVAANFPTVAPPTGVKDLAGNQTVGISPAVQSRF